MEQVKILTISYFSPFLIGCSNEGKFLGWIKKDHSIEWIAETTEAEKLYLSFIPEIFFPFNIRA